MESSVLKPEHQVELKKFLYFFELKRQESLKELEIAMVESVKNELHDDMMYSRHEVEAMLLSLRYEAKSVLEQELQNITRMSAVYAKTLIHQLDTAGLTFTVDTSYLENQRLIEEMVSLEKAQKTVEMPKATSSARLPTLQASYVNDPALTRQLQAANEELMTLRSRVRTLQEEMATILMDRSSLSSQFQSSETSTKELTDELNADRRRIEKQESLIAELKAEQEGRLRDAKQVKMLKEMLDKKNAQLKELREEVAKLNSR
jgi:chromosome segregation ATPase